MTKEEVIIRLVGQVEALSEALLNATELFDEPYTEEEYEEAKNLCSEAKALLK